MTPPADFDHMFHDWHVSHRRLQTRLAGAADWQVFTGTSTTRPVMGGFGNIEDNLIDLPGGSLRAIAVRSFDATAGQWAIWWLADSNPHHLDTPVVGGFSGGIGTFYAEETFNGAPVRVRFRWDMTTPTRPVWEQAFSPDAGATWETNWTMVFSRP
jgi:hypothetical protein